MRQLGSRLQVLWLVISLVASLTACKTSGDNQDTAASEQRGRSTISVEAGMVETLRSEGTAPEVLALLEDGELTFEEYEQTVFGFMRCMEDFGFEAVRNFPRLTPWGTYQVRIASFDFGSRGITPGEVTAHDQACEQSYWRGISRLWDLAHQPTEIELQNARRDFASCLRERGIEMDVDPSSQVLTDGFAEAAQGLPELDDWVSCYWRVDDEHFITGTDFTLAPGQQ